jgi:hypothetical protein
MDETIESKSALVLLGQTDLRTFDLGPTLEFVVIRPRPGLGVLATIGMRVLVRVHHFVELGQF